MGCMDSYRPEEDLRAAEEQIRSLGRMLCAVCQQAADGKVPDLGSGELARWWKRHQEEDASRVEAERQQRIKSQLADSAKSKLTEQELQALGLRS